MEVRLLLCLAGTSASAIYVVWARLIARWALIATVADTVSASCLEYWWSKESVVCRGWISCGPYDLFLDS